MTVMKKWVEKQNKFKRLGKDIRAYASVAGHRIQAHSFYQPIQSCLGKKGVYWVAGGSIFLFFVLALTYWGRSGNGDRQTAKPPTPVLAAKVRKGDVPLYLNAIGTVTPLESLTVKSQINGRILRVHFDEGQMVTKGQLLVDIDPLPYEALLKQYQGQLVRDEALLNNARLDLKRYKKLYAQDSVSQQMLETQIHVVKQYEGTVSSDQGLIDSAKVNLHYCRITADISGMVGLRQVNPGNLVQATDTTPITTINQISPITVVFPIPEDDLGQVQEKMKSRASLVADAFDGKGEKILATGRFLAMDSQIDHTTGTIKLKAIFDNKDSRLFPNQFVNIRLNIDTLPDALIVPTAAVQTGRQGPFLYVVNEKDKTVSVKLVTVKTRIEGESVVEGDIAEGLLVVVQGTDKLSEGALVTVTPGGEPKERLAA
ncbi:MAG: multidrug transporter subunit MdtA [Alphaproteobacteria bacterium]|jgi:multidrug efflux system membrane fusion protein|nr:multidrug transporter subunit MdtA [Alphaproteobacteria bacterium]